MVLICLQNKQKKGTGNRYPATLMAVPDPRFPFLNALCLFLYKPVALLLHALL